MTFGKHSGITQNIILQMFLQRSYIYYIYIYILYIYIYIILLYRVGTLWLGKWEMNIKWVLGMRPTMNWPLVAKCLALLSTITNKSWMPDLLWRFDTCLCTHSSSIAVPAGSLPAFDGINTKKTDLPGTVGHRHPALPPIYTVYMRHMKIVFWCHCCSQTSSRVCICFISCLSK